MKEVEIYKVKLFFSLNSCRILLIYIKNSWEVKNKRGFNGGSLRNMI